MPAQSYKVQTHLYDVVVVGAGGAGLRATMGLAAKGLSAACVPVKPPKGAAGPRFGFCKAGRAGP